MKDKYLNQNIKQYDFKAFKGLLNLLFPLNEKNRTDKATCLLVGDKLGVPVRALALSLGLSLLLLGGCAEPKYIKVQEGDPGSMGALQEEQQQQWNCEVAFKNSEYCLTWGWLTPPTEKTEGELAFKVYRKNLWDDSVVLEDLSDEVELVLWMPSMGHGSTPTRIERKDVGTYLALKVFFIMPGDWELRFVFKKDKKVIDEAVVALFI